MNQHRTLDTGCTEKDRRGEKGAEEKEKEHKQTARKSINRFLVK